MPLLYNLLLKSVTVSKTYSSKVKIDFAKHFSKGSIGAHISGTLPFSPFWDLLHFIIWASLGKQQHNTSETVL